MFLQIRAFTDKGPVIFTDKVFLQIRASQTVEIDAFTRHSNPSSASCVLDF